MTTPKPAALLATEYPEAFCRELAQRVTVLGPFKEPLRQALAPDQAAAVRIVITMGTLKVDGAMMDALPNLGLICNYGSGYEGTDHDEAAARGIVVTNSVGGNASAVADLGVGLLLAVCRKIVAADRLVRSGGWVRTSAERIPSVRGMTGRKVGIFGLGAIGEKIARRVEAFETEVGYFNRAPRADVPWRHFDSLAALANWADVLVVAARADAGNRHIVNGDILRALGPDGIVVNIGRGSLIDEAALAAALDAGEITGAGLDVFEQEPSVPEALRQSDKVVLTPHIAGGAHEAHALLREMVLANVDAFLAGRPVPNPVRAVSAR